MTVRMAMVVALATLAATDAEAQGLSQYYGPDGKVYSRRALDSDYAPPNVPSDILRPNAHASRRVSVKLRRPLQCFHSIRPCQSQWSQHQQHQHQRRWRR
jgi:hypothetical protein